MQSHPHEEESTEMLSYTSAKAFDELAIEAASLQEQRTQLDNQRVLLDLEHAELEEQLLVLKLKYAILNVHYDHLEYQEYALSSEHDVVRVVGNRRF